MNDTLLSAITITRTLDCVADPTKMRAVAELTDDVSELMPYLNALLTKASYNHSAQILHFNLEYRMITLYARMVTMAKVDDVGDARRIAGWLKDLINDAYRRRGEIEPSYEYRTVLKPLDIFVRLPRENCKRCGEVTCMAFAFRLCQGRGEIEECPLLFEERFHRHRDAFAALLGP